MADEQLQLKLELETENAKREATEALGSIEEEVKNLAETFTDISTKLESVADSFSVLKTRSAADLENVSKTVRKTEEDFEELTNTQERGTQKMGISGKVMGAVWKDLSSGMGALKERSMDLLGLRGLALGGIGVTGGLVALTVGSFLTVDKIDTAIKNLSFDAQGLRGQLLGLKETRAGDTFELMGHHVDVLHEKFKGLGHKGAVEVMSAFAKSGIEVKSLTDSTRDLSVSFDTILNLPVGTVMGDWASKSKEFGQDINFVASNMVALYGDFGAFIEQGRKGAVTITDLVNSLEMASRSLSGWRTNWKEMVDLQLLYIKGAEKAGMSTEGARLSFADLAGTLSNLSKEKWGFILQNMEGAGAGATGNVKESIDRVKGILASETKAMGGGFAGQIEAARSMMVSLSDEKKGGKPEDISTWMGMITEGMQAKGIEGKGLQMMWLQEQMGMSREVAKGITEMGEFYKKEKAGTMTEADRQKREEKLKDIGKQQIEDRMSATEKITAGIARWWVRVAPSIFSMIMGAVDLIVKAIGVIAGETEWKDVKESMAFTSAAFGKFINVTKTEFNNMLDIGKDVKGMGGFLPPSWGKDEEESKLSIERELIKKLPSPDEGWKKVGMKGRNQMERDAFGVERGSLASGMAGIVNVVRGKELYIKVTKGQILQVLGGNSDETSKGGV